MGGLKPVHLLVLLVVILLLFGAKKLPEIAGSVGKSAKVFKKEIKELREDDDPATSYAATGGQPPQAYQPPQGQSQAYPQPQPQQYPQQYAQPQGPPPVTQQPPAYPQQPPADGAAPQQGTGSHQA